MRTVGQVVMAGADMDDQRLAGEFYFQYAIGTDGHGLAVT